MKVLYANEPPYDPNRHYGNSEESAIFLVGPTPRSSEVPSWRPYALEVLEKINYDGVVLVPERPDWTKESYIDQVEWEYEGLLACASVPKHRILAWVPRCMKTMPALTTNVEFGFWLAKAPERICYGRPEYAPNTAYLDWMYYKFTNKQPISILEDLLIQTVKEISNEQ